MFSRRFADETKVDDIQEKEADIGTYANKVANLFDEIDKEKMPTLATTQNIFMRCLPRAWSKILSCLIIL